MFEFPIGFILGFITGTSVSFIFLKYQTVFKAGICYGKSIQMLKKAEKLK